MTVNGRWLDWPLTRIILGRKASPLFPWFPFSVYPLPYLISFPYKRESRCWCLVVWAIPLKNPYILVFDVCSQPFKWYPLWVYLPPTIDIYAVGQISLKFSALCLSLAVSNVCNTLPTISYNLSKRPFILHGLSYCWSNRAHWRPAWQKSKEAYTKKRLKRSRKNVGRLLVGNSSPPPWTSRFS